MLLHKLRYNNDCENHAAPFSVAPSILSPMYESYVPIHSYKRDCAMDYYVFSPGINLCDHEC